GAQGEGAGGEPPVALGFVDPRLEMGLDAGRDGLAGAGVEAAIASLADRPAPDDLLVADRHRLRPPAVNAEFMFDVGGDLVVRLLRRAPGIEKLPPLAPGL